MNDTQNKNTPIWKAVCTALGSEHRDAKEISGASGLIHPVEAIGVDEKGKRLILVSSETNPRIAALLRGDVQATTSDLRVLVARPMAIDLAYAARKLFFTESGALDMSKLLGMAAALQAKDGADNQVNEVIGEPTAELFSSAARSALPLKTHIFNVVEQFHNLNIDLTALIKSDDKLQSFTELLTAFSKMDNLAGDREQGICPFPTYELSDEEWEIFASNKNIDDVKQVLKNLDIYQYFYPPADRLALGLIDRGLNSASELDNGFELSKLQGHDVAMNELVSDAVGLDEVIEALKAEGYVMEGEFAMEVAEEGKVIRRKLNIRPSEGLIARLSKMLSVKVDLNLKDLFGPK